MFEYRVEAVVDQPLNLSWILNVWAKEGWRVVSVCSTSYNHWTVILERAR